MHTINIFLIVQFILVQSDLSGEAALYKVILEDYEVLERPVHNYTDAVDVHLKLELQQIIDIDEKNQVMEVNVWLHYIWADSRLTWDREQFDDVENLRFPVNQIWKPDVLLFNSVDDSFDSAFPSNVLVSYDGTVEWIPPAVTRSSCSLNITWFPFDEQLCFLKFGSWSYTKDKINLIGDGTDITEYILVPNGEWTLLDTCSNQSADGSITWNICEHTAVKVEDVQYPDGKEFRYLKYNFRLQRRTLYFGFNLIIPSLLIAVMSIWGFLLPAESSEKITLEMTVLLSICVFMGMVAETTPITSESVPLLSIFCFCHMIAVTVSIVFSVLVLNFYYRTPQTHSMSPWTRTVLLNWLPWLLMMSRPDHDLRPPPIFSNALGEDLEGRNKDRPSTRSVYIDRTRVSSIRVNRMINSRVYFEDTKPTYVGKVDTDDIELRVENCIRPLIECSNPPDVAIFGQNRGVALQAVLISLQQIQNELKFITEHKKKEDAQEAVVNDWKFAAMVVDRMCLGFFSVFIICATFGVLFSAPHFNA